MCCDSWGRKESDTTEQLIRSDDSGQNEVTGIRITLSPEATKKPYKICETTVLNTLAAMKGHDP